MNAPLVPTDAARGADPLAALRGLHLPDPVGFWPPAPGWWIVAALLLCAAAGLVWAVRRRQRRLGARALAELASIERRTVDLASLATALSELLRRVALERFGAARVASLAGDAWRAFLLETAPRTGRHTAFDDAAGRVLAIVPYAPPEASAEALAGLDRGRLIAAARDWIRGNT